MRVADVSDSGKVGTYSAATEAKAAFKFDAPGDIFRSKVDRDSMTASWKAVSGAPGYTVRVYSKGNPTKFFTTTGTSVNLTGLKASTNYFIRVYVVQPAAGSTDEVRLSDDSPEIQQATTSYKLATPDGLKVTSQSPTSVGLSWTGVAGAPDDARYKVSYAYNYAQTDHQSTSGAFDGTSGKLTGLRNDTTYFAILYLVDKDGKRLTASSVHRHREVDRAARDHQRQDRRRDRQRPDGRRVHDLGRRRAGRDRRLGQQVLAERAAGQLQGPAHVHRRRQQGLGLGPLGQRRRLDLRLRLDHRGRARQDHERPRRRHQGRQGRVGQGRRQERRPDPRRRPHRDRRPRRRARRHLPDPQRLRRGVLPRRASAAASTGSAPSYSGDGFKIESVNLDVSKDLGVKVTLDTLPFRSKYGASMHGTRKVGKTMDVTATPWLAGTYPTTRATMSYQWKRNGAAIKGATGGPTSS